MIALQKQEEDTDKAKSLVHKSTDKEIVAMPPGGKQRELLMTNTRLKRI